MKYARRCDATGRGINEGYVFGDGDTLYFSTKELLIEFMKTLDWEDDDGNLSQDLTDDDDIMEYFYNEDAYYYTEWDAVDEDEWYDEEGNKYYN